ncbi:hypothetical protein P692DRAFT_20820988 [Suillus brevipes Sb2]|nr:hypothetical protein P692DRAFT_20820988 [Suillus brevipes Sb2]
MVQQGFQADVIRTIYKYLSSYEKMVEVIEAMREAAKVHAVAEILSRTEDDDVEDNSIMDDSVKEDSQEINLSNQPSNMHVQALLALLDLLGDNPMSLSIRGERVKSIASALMRELRVDMSFDIDNIHQGNLTEELETTEVDLKGDSGGLKRVDVDVGLNFLGKRNESLLHRTGSLLDHSNSCIHVFFRIRVYPFCHQVVIVSVDVNRLIITTDPKEHHVCPETTTGTSRAEGDSSSIRAMKLSDVSRNGRDINSSYASDDLSGERNRKFSLRNTAIIKTHCERRSSGQARCLAIYVCCFEMCLKRSEKSDWRAANGALCNADGISTSRELASAICVNL